MLSRDDNALLTEVGPGTPMGELLRRYWIPALLAEELPGPDCDPVRVQLLHERLVPSATTKDASASSTSSAPIAPHRSSSAATRSAASAAPTTAGSTT